MLEDNKLLMGSPSYIIINCRQELHNVGIPILPYLKLPEKVESCDLYSEIFFNPLPLIK